MLMTYHLFAAFFIFAFVSSITPGPNTLMLLASGVNFGFVRSIPHMLGVTLGFSAMVLIVGLGLGEVFIRYPLIYSILRYLSAAYLLYLAWQIFRSDPIGEENICKKPFSFLKAAIFQWINPKAWVMTVAAITTYSLQYHFFASVMLISIGYLLFVGPSCCIWTAFGNWFRTYLNEPLHLRIFNITMAVLLVLSLYPLFINI